MRPHCLEDCLRKELEMVQGERMEGVHQEGCGRQRNRRHKKPTQRGVWRLEAEREAFQQKEAPQQVEILEGREDDRQ